MLKSECLVRFQCVSSLGNVEIDNLSGSPLEYLQFINICSYHLQLLRFFISVLLVTIAILHVLEFATSRPNNQIISTPSLYECRSQREPAIC